MVAEERVVAVRTSFHGNFKHLARGSHHRTGRPRRGHRGLRAEQLQGRFESRVPTHGYAWSVPPPAASALVTAKVLHDVEVPVWTTAHTLG